MAEGVDGLLRDKTRPPGKPPVPDDRAATVVAIALKSPLHEATHWTARSTTQPVGSQTGDLIPFVSGEMRIYWHGNIVFLFGDNRISNPATVLHLTLEFTPTTTSATARQRSAPR